MSLSHSSESLNKDAEEASNGLGSNSTAAGRKRARVDEVGTLPIPFFR